MQYRRTNLRWVAAFEAVKGILVLATAAAAFEFFHKDAQQAAERLVGHFHLNPASRYPRIFLEMASNLTNIHLLALGLGALAYAVIRLVEAYGLWHGKRWAWVFGMASAGLYIPIEVYELIKHVNAAELILFLANIAILGALWLGRAK
ncbi:DUF2127 domain-containing protein [Nitrosovibrio tenuis]|uniref:Uncharacterized membrane protein, DUF2068 family n=1 Tax=Nitrosovibrio tenuis TaxID=1233 RepID=A0A1H7LJ17_9PROT|nr:DUF2127 domain-containing protein [Nitrosovibrio tenuis]SEK98789.1 Uncharacterized membrane protein, DUF2068 family [Nitrosovibrio tenuis]